LQKVGVTSYHYQIYAPPLGCLDPILSWVAIGSSQPMQESPEEPTTAWTNVYMCMFIQKTSWSTSNTFLIRYRSSGTPNEPQPHGACELQGQWIEALRLPSLVLPVNAYRWVLADNSRLEIKPHEPKNADKTRAKRRVKTKGDKKPN
jgi:hypothetical protein